MNVTPRHRVWLSCVTLVLLAAHHVSTISLKDLDQLVRNHPEQLCELMQCEGSMKSAADCPYGTRWIEGITVGGCCGGCVKFMQEGEYGCTGKVDPKPCLYGLETGYGMCEGPAESTSYRAFFQRHDTEVARHGSLLGSLQRKKPKVDNVLYSHWCDYGMFCNANVCFMEVTWVTCQNTQEAYDRDMKNDYYVSYRDDYRWRPDCSVDGNYAPKQCKSAVKDQTKSCVCVDPQGYTLFGKAFSFQGRLYDDMNCLCSRRVYEKEQAGETLITLHCMENGNFEALQCENDFCYCVHTENGTFWGYQMPKASINLLPCFNSTLVGDLYERHCESRSYARSILVDVMARKGILNFPSPGVTCNSQGSYNSTRCVGRSCHCYSKYGKDCQAGGDNGCACTTDLLTYNDYGQMAGQLFCEINMGNYTLFQEWTSVDASYMVDGEGSRISPVARIACQENLVPLTLIECQKLGNNAKGTQYCSEVCMGGIINDKHCPSSVYYFSTDYEMSGDCLKTT